MPVDMHSRQAVLSFITNPPGVRLCGNTALFSRAISQISSMSF
jgi:hypothetical protein